jgi:hypothetical protein
MNAQIDKSAHAIANARGWLESMREMIEAIGAAEESGDEQATDRAREALQESPLSVLVRNGWHTPGSGEEEGRSPQEYEILLSTGGPALRVVGDLDQHCTPDDEPCLEWQDWGTPWTVFPLTEAERDTVCTFARQFWFGE